MLSSVKKHSYMSSGLVDLFPGKILKFPKHFGDIFARAVSAIEHSEEDEVFKELFLELLKKPPYKHKPYVNNKLSSTTRVLLVSTWSSGSRKIIGEAMKIKLHSDPRLYISLQDVEPLPWHLPHI